MPLTPVGAACAAIVAWSVRRIFRVLTGDCDTRTMSATIKNNFFSAKIVWITGASSGIGASLAVQLAREGARLILTSRREDKLIELADSLPCPRENVYVLPLDLLSDISHVEEVAASVPAIFGRLDFLFNNAGVSTRASAEDLSIEHVQRVLQLNFLAPVALARSVLPALRAAPSGRGTIVNTVSIATIVCTPLRCTYSASKAALTNYFRCLELEEPHIRVINTFPGSVRTPIAFNALAPGGKPFGRSDVNIEAGLDPKRVADRILAAVSSDISNPWIARPKELLAVRIASLFPSVWDVIAAKRAEGYRKSIENS